MKGPLGIRSVIDVGCGRGISTLYFLNNGADVMCIEGSHDAGVKTFVLFTPILRITGYTLHNRMLMCRVMLYYCS